MRIWADKMELPVACFTSWLGIARGKFYDWKKRYGRVNEHNGHVPRDHWLEAWEIRAILDYHERHPLEGYRRLAFMMLDEDVVAASPSSVYRVLAREGRLAKWSRGRSKKGTGFAQPDRPHQHWHIDIAYLNVGGTFYYLCCVLDGASRAIVHWDVLTSMTEADVEMILVRAHEKHPGSRPRVISDNGPQFIAKDFKAFIRLVGMTHVRTSPYYPQSNGKLERFHKTAKSEAIRPAAPSTLEEARTVVARFIDHYNNRRLHSAIGYVTPNDYLAGRAPEIWAARDRKLEAAREKRAQRRAEARAERAA